MRVVKEIVSVEQTRRVLICERDDGLFMFVEERMAAEPPSFRWVRVSGQNSLLDSIEAAVREAGLRVEWLHRELTWPARDNPPAAVAPRRGGVVDCTACGITFFIKDRARWGGGRHLTCGQRIDLSETPAS